MSADTGNVITGIMKHNECMKDSVSQDTADSTEQSGRGESSSQSIRTADSPDTESVLQNVNSIVHNSHNSAFEDQACSLQAHGPITWAKTIEVIYF